MFNLNNHFTVKDIALIALLTALSVGGSYALIGLPNINLMDIVVFVTSFVFGIPIGVAVSILSWSIYGIINPLGFVLPIWISTIIGESLFGFVGGILGMINPNPKQTLSSGKKSFNSNIKVTPEGGLAIKMINKTGGASVKGTVVTPYDDTAIDRAVEKIVVDIPNPIGVVWNNDVPDGSLVWIVISGRAYVYFVGNTTRGHIARGFLTADGGSYVIGQALSEQVPVSPFASDKHFYEIGHVLESVTGPGLALVNLHFN